MEKIDLPIFLDPAHKRWGRFKILLIFILFILTLVASSTVYSYFYSPFNIDRSHEKDLTESITKINDERRLVRGNGSFFKMTKNGGKEYLEKVSTNKKTVVLSFDDGPDPVYTKQIVNVLKKEGVKGTFFETGERMYRYPEVSKYVLENGFDIGLHTFSHTENPEDRKIPPFNYLLEMDFTEKIFVHNFGYKSELFRVPYLGGEENPSYDALQYIGEGLKRGMAISAPSVDSFDWKEKSVAKIVENATESNKNNVVILFHDSGGDRSLTIKALPQVIKHYKDRGYTFTTASELAHDLGLPYKSNLSMSEKVFSNIVFYAYDAYEKAPKLLEKGFIVGFIFVLLHSLLFLVLATLQVLVFFIRRRIDRKKKNYSGLISVVVPMYNEERSITPAIESVLKSSIKKLELIVVDDGCTDRSFEQVSHFLKDKRVKIVTQKNYGKYKALNRGLEEAKGKYVVFIDADTRVTEDAISKIISYLRSPKVGAVAGNISIGNTTNILTSLQDIEYTAMQGIEKRVLDLFGIVTVVPGAFGAWRTDLVKKIGGFSHKTNAEDFDLTIEVAKRGYKVKFAHDAIAETEAPTKVKDLLKQRFRWNFGNLQVLYKHRGMFLNIRYGILGLFVLPRTMLVQIPSMLFAPFVDIIAIISFVFIDMRLTIIFLLLYFLIQLVMTHAAYIYLNKPFEKPHYVFLMRFPYTQLMFSSLLLAFHKAFKGDFFIWTKLQHTGAFARKAS